MRIQVIDEQGVLWSDHPVGIHVDPDHGLCDLCEKHTPVLFDVTIYPSDDFPILRCHDCVGDGSPGEQLVGVATAPVPDSHDIYIIDPHGYVRLPHDQAHTVGQELAEHLAQAPPPRPRPQPRPLWPDLARLADHHLWITAVTAGPPAPAAPDPPPPPAGSHAPAVPGAAHRPTQADQAQSGGHVAHPTVHTTWFDLVAPDTPGQQIWDEQATPAPGERALLIGDPVNACIVTGDLAGLERLAGALMARLRAERAGEQDPHDPPAVAFDPDAARTWLAEHAEADGPTGDHTPQGGIANRLETLIHELGRDTHPRVWRTAPDIGDIVVWPTAAGEPDLAEGGAVLSVNVGAVHLVTHPLTASDLTGLRPDATAPPARPWIDAAHKALRVAAFAVNEVVARWRFATGQYTPRSRDELAYDGWSNNPPKRPLTARERDILVRILRDMVTAATSPTPTAVAVDTAELHLLAQVREVIDPRTD